MKFFTRKNILYTLLTVIILAATTWSFVHIITNDTRKDTEAQMRELSNQSLNTISQKLHADSVCLRSIAETVGGSTLQLNTEALRSYLERKRSIYGFGDIVVVDLEGNALSAIGAKLPNMAQEAFISQALRGNVVLHNGHSKSNHEEYIVRIATPLRRNGQTIAVLYGVYLPNQLRAMLAHRLFDNSSHMELVTSAGDVIAAPNITYHTLDGFIDVL